VFLTILVIVTNAIEPQTREPEFAKVLDTWNENDIQQFLKDRNVKYESATGKIEGDDSKLSVDQLKALASVELAKLYDASNKYESLVYDQAHSFRDNLVDLKETVLSYVWPKHISEKVSRSYGYLTTTDDSNTSWLSKSKDISDWAFDSWSIEQLQKTLDSHKIKYKSNAKKSDLIKLAKKNFSKISSNSKASGRYPGDWLFSAWATLDLRKWLHDHNVGTANRLSDDRDYLLKQVRENLYPASWSLKESKDELFESLNLPSSQKDVVDQGNGFKEDLVKKWSESQLSTWLTHHGVEVSDKVKHDKESLLKLVEDNRASLKSDIEEWLEYAKRKASDASDAVSEKVPSKEEADNVINDTFVIDVEKWPKDRLNSFLTSRGVSIPLFATRKDLVKLVKKYKSRRLLDFSKLKPDVLFEGWSTDQIKGWLISNKIDATGYRDDLVKKASDLYDHLQKENFYKEQALSLANTAKDTAVDYGKKGKEVADQLYDDYKEPVGEFLTTAKDKLYDAAVATKDYGSTFIDYLSSWSKDDLQRYLESFGVKNTAGLSHEDLLTKAKKNTLAYFHGDGRGWFDKKTPEPVKTSWFSLDYWKGVWAGSRL